MIAEPELIIGFEYNRIPVAATCTRCGEFMPEAATEGLTSAEVIMQFVIDFKEHMRKKHSDGRSN